MKSLRKKLFAKLEVSGFVASLAVAYLRLVKRTSRIEIWPHGILDDAASVMPCILATWHGQSYFLPVVTRPEGRFSVLISPHRNGRILAAIVHKLGHAAVRGSGPGLKPKNMMRRRGAAALIEMLDALRSGRNVVLTADVPKIARIAGPGIIYLAQHSGRLIIPVAMAASRKRVLKSTWDKTTIFCPFSRIVVLFGAPVAIESDAPEHLAAKRLELETALNAANAEADRLAARRDS